jgi:hypothetical protein
MVDGVTIAIIAVVLALLVLAFASGRRDADRARAGERPSGWRGSAMWLGIFGATAGAGSGGDDRDGHHGGGDYGGGGGDFGGGGGWGGGDFGGGGGGDGGGGGN